MHVSSCFLTCVWVQVCVHACVCEDADASVRSCVRVFVREDVSVRVCVSKCALFAGEEKRNLI